MSGIIHYFKKIEACKFEEYEYLGTTNLALQTDFDKANERLETKKQKLLTKFQKKDENLKHVFMCFEKSVIDGQVLNIASGTPVHIREVIAETARLVGAGHPQFGQVAYRPGENMALVADIELAKRLLGWSPKISLTEGLRMTMETMKLHGS